MKHSGMNAFQTTKRECLDVMQSMKKKAEMG